MSGLRERVLGVLRDNQTEIGMKYPDLKQHLADVPPKEVGLMVWELVRDHKVEFTAERGLKPERHNTLG